MLSAMNVCLQRNGRQLLDQISLTLPERGSVALIGPNGAGKSTLLSLLGGQLQPDSGAVNWHGQSLAKLKVRERSQSIGYMPQRYEPYWDVTLAELLEMRLGASVDVTRVLTDAQLSTFATRRWSTLSGGERARAMLSAVLATDPPALLADEPGAALDVQHRLALVDALAARGRDRLVVVVMHDIDLAFECFERVIVLHQGRIALDGAPAELLNAPSLDDVFGVHFERIAAPPQTLLRARKRAAFQDKEGTPCASI